MCDDPGCHHDDHTQEVTAHAVLFYGHMHVTQCTNIVMKSEFRSIVSVTAAILFWSSSFIATKIAGTVFSPLFLCLVRFALASALFLLLRLCGFHPVRPQKRDAYYIALTAVSGITVYYALENIGVQMTTAGNASLISAAYPAITAFVGILFYRERANRTILSGIAIALVGIVVLNDWSTLSLSKGGGGNFLLLADGFLWAYYNYTMQKISDRMDPLSISYWQTLLGTVLFVPLVWLEKPVWNPVPIEAWLAVGYLSVCCTVAALFLYNVGIRRIPASLAASLMNLTPVFGVLLSAWILHEAVTLRQIIGGAIILFGVWISTQKATE